MTDPLRSKKWIESLRTYVGEGKSDGESEKDSEDAELRNEIETTRELDRIVIEHIQKQSQNDPSLRQIPRFFRRQDDSLSRLQNIAKREGRRRLLQSKLEILLDPNELSEIWDRLQELSEERVTEDGFESEDPEDGWISYEGFCAIGNELDGDEKQFEYFSPSIFARFPKNPYGHISIMHFFQYLVMKVKLHESRINLTVCDESGDSHLRERDLESFLLEVMQHFPALQGVSDAFLPFYLCTAARRFFFELDGRKSGRISIAEICRSNALAEFLELDVGGEEEGGPTPDLHTLSLSPSPSLSLSPTSWFSTANALRVYGQYLQLDLDRNGMLSKAELRRYNGGGITPTAVERVFQVSHTYGGEIDYKTYLDFVLAMENRRSPSSIRYFFSLFDLSSSGHIGDFELHYFLRDILSAVDDANIRPELLKNEIIDLLAPKHRNFITLSDFLGSKAAETVIGVLVDVSSFWQYENREWMISQQQQEEGEREREREREVEREREAERERERSERGSSKSVTYAMDLG